MESTGEWQKDVWVERSPFITELGKGDFEKGLFEFKRLGIPEIESRSMLNINVRELQNKISPPLKIWNGAELRLPPDIPQLPRHWL